MSISVIGNRRGNIPKTVVAYLILTLAAIAFSRVYALFSHGVSSGSMTWLFLYPLLGGAAFYTLLGLLLPAAPSVAGYRLFYNLHNSGVATLSAASLLQGILEIAGTASAYTVPLSYAGWTLAGGGLAVLLTGLIRRGCGDSL